MRHDLPGGAVRFVMPAAGIEYTVVNGEIIYDHGKPTGNRSGRLLRSGVN